LVIARCDSSALPDFAAKASVVDFPLYPNGPGGGEALRLLLALAEQPVSADAQAFAAQLDASAADFIAQTRAVRNSANRLQALLADGGPWGTSSALGSAVADRLIGLREYDAALRGTEKLRKQFPNAHRPQHLQALALARRGMPTDLTSAQSVLESLYMRGERDPETVGIYARTFMDNYHATGNAAALRKSRDLYAEAYELAPDSYYNGINAAAKSIFLQNEADVKKGRDYAAELQTWVGRNAIPGDYWKSATVAETHLILGDYDAAAKVYKEAIEIAPNDKGSHDSTWKQASKLMAVLQVPAAARARIREAFGNPPSVPSMDVTQEIRFALVMYGGVSLAIYINGVAQEFLRMVRATAADPKDRNQPLLSKVTGTERVYRRAAQLLGREGDDVKRAVTPDDPIRARFVVDILSGTSAGGINGIFLAKALANHQSIDELKQLWVDEGAIEQLINDGKSVKNLDGLKEENPPTSLLNGRRMYRKLLDAFDGMDRESKATPRSPFVDELDLFVTTTDIRGLPVFLRLADDVVPELRHRNVFRFRYSDGFSTDAANDFLPESNPFLAYAARCTSSFPFAFPPMKLTDIDEVLEHTPGREKDSGLGKDAEKWRRFFPAYAPPVNGNEAAPAVYEFTNRAFGDGGYLDNKPFGHATDVLRSRRGGVASQRKLVFIEPSPDHPVLAAPPEARPNVIENVGAALSLARYETIRDDLDRVRSRNRLVERVGRILGGMEEDVRVGQEANPTIRDDFDALDLEKMIRLYGIAYGGYHRLKVAGLTDELAGLLTRISQFDDRSDEFYAIRYLVRAWREMRFVPYLPRVAGNTSRESNDAPVRAESENAFLARYDLPYRLRRLEFVLSKIDQLSCIDQTTRELFKQRNGGDMPQSEGDRAAFRAELARLRGEIRNIYEPLRRGRDALQMRGEKNPIAASVAGLGLHQTDLHALLACATDHDRLEYARDLLTNERRSQALESLAEVLRNYVAALTMEASAKCTALLSVSQNANQASAQAPAPASKKSFAAVATEFVRHYYESYERYDLISYPVLQSSDVGEELNTVDVVRISPEDAPSLIDERHTKRRKLAGTKLMHFGAFLDRGWRQNDILWGRMDGAERILSTILPADDPEMESLLKEAQLAILEEEFGSTDRDRLCRLLVDGLIAQSSPDKSEAALRALAERELGSPINEALQAALRAKLDKEELHGFFGSSYEVNPDLNPKLAVQSLARSTRVVGSMLQQLSDDYKVGGSPSLWVSRLGRTFWRLVEVAVPNTVPNIIVRHWLNLLYLFEGLLIVGGTLFAESTIQRFGLTTLAVTLGIHSALAVVGDVMRSRRRWIKVLRIAVVIPLVLLIGLGIYALIDDLTRKYVWAQLVAVFS
jgi:patatin-related protein